MNTQGCGSLDEAIDTLIKNLQGLLNAHHVLLKQENKKREAILTRNTQLLQNVVRKQSELLAEIDFLESTREASVVQISRITERNKLTLITRISDILAWEEFTEVSRKKIKSYSDALRTVLGSLKIISESNAILLKDSREMFRSLIEGLARVSKQDYIGDAEASQRRPIFIDANC